MVEANQSFEVPGLLCIKFYIAYLSYIMTYYYIEIKMIKQEVKSKAMWSKNNSKLWLWIK